MPSRERWIVYPLLFLALGLAMRPSLVSTMEVQDIRCRSITSGNANVHHLRLVDRKGHMHGELAVRRDGGNLNLWKYGGPIAPGEALIIAGDSDRHPVRIGEVIRRPALPEPPKEGAPAEEAANKEAAANEK